MTNARFAKLVVWVNGAVPAALLVWDASRGQLGANPVNFAIRTTGLLALIFLMGSLFISPLRLVTGLDALLPHRRILGLYAAFYAFAHFGIFFWWDREHDLASTWHEIVERKYIWYGMTALVVFVPLAITSTAGMVQRLGPKGWKWLHRLVYVAAISGAVHYLNIGKFPSTQSMVFAALFASLLVFRVVASHVQLRIAYHKLSAAQGAAPAKPKFWTGPLRLARVFRETPDVQTFRLVPVQGGALPFDYVPGQYLTLHLLVDGKKVSRSYTLASSPTRQGYCEITVKREEMGLSSRHLHDALKPGDIIQVAGPAGRFTFTGGEAKSVVLIAGGVGITPLMSKLRYLTDLAWGGEIHFIFVGRTEQDIIFKSELAELRQRHPNLHVTITLTRAEPSWSGERGRLGLELLNRVIPNLPSHEFHICGPDAMAEETRKLLATAGVPESLVKFESFTPASRGAADPAEAPAVPAGAASVTFERSGKSTAAKAGSSILELAEAQGVNIDFDCRSGNCGTCKIRLKSGHVSMETQAALSAQDKADGMILACQARALDEVTVDA
jgi:ferredoxin-NADP reductase/DMSO/TMAO reductase YedYZ heme-binding membrane subunit